MVVGRVGKGWRKRKFFMNLLICMYKIVGSKEGRGFTLYHQLKLHTCIPEFD